MLNMMMMMSRGISVHAVLLMMLGMDKNWYHVDAAKMDRETEALIELGTEPGVPVSACTFFNLCAANRVSPSLRCKTPGDRQRFRGGKKKGSAEPRVFASARDRMKAYVLGLLR
jgi:hypothetical protein